MIWAPWSAAYLMPSAMPAASRRLTARSEASGSLNSSVTRTERIFAAGATPVLPDPCPWPAIRPATAVPSTPQNGPPGSRPRAAVPL